MRGNKDEIKASDKPKNSSHYVAVKYGTTLTNRTTSLFVQTSTVLTLL
jgi:hypothetical protein